MPTASSSAASAFANRSASASDARAGAAQRRHRRPLRERLLQPRDPAALLIDADPGRRSCGRAPRTRPTSSATCSGASMLRLNRITPPRSNSRASDRSSTGMLRARHAADQKLSNVASRRQGHACFENYNCVVRIAASAPTRIDLAGGTIDIWPLYLFHPGAQTLNAAISLRARAWIEPRPDERIELRLGGHRPHGRTCPFDQLRDDETLPLLARLVHRFGAHGIRLTTRGESPAGAGIAGSSALNVAVCGALAAYHGGDHRRRGAAADREERRSAGRSRCRPGCRTTGRRCTAASPPSSSRRRRPVACRSTSTRRSSSSASCSATPASRATRAPTTGRSPSGTSTATSTSSTASSASATPPRRCARRSTRGDWDAAAACLAAEWEQPQAAGPGRHDAGDRRR